MTTARPAHSDHPRHAVSGAAQQGFLQEVRPLLRDDVLLETPEALLAYEVDALMAKRRRPWRVALPHDRDEVAILVRAAHRHGIPIVPRGAGTGLSGGAMPHADGLVLSLARMNRILEVDCERCLARVEPGVTNLAISDHVRGHGLYYAPDPSSQIACTIGGNVAENSGGVHCLKYGLTLHNLQSMTVITADGETLQVGSSAPQSAGLDLMAALVGSEGLLGIVVEVTVRLLPVPPSVHLLLAAFDDVAVAGDAVGQIIARGIVPAGLEMMDGPAIRAAEDFAQAGYPRDAAALLLCELDGVESEAAETAAEVAALLRGLPSCTEVRTAADAEQRARFWQGRKSAFPAVGRISPDYYCMDGTIPRRAIGKVLSAIGEMARRYGLGVANVFHAGDGNLHPLILYDSSRVGDAEKAEAFGAEILELSVAVGGTITGEHGVGVEKLDQMCVQFGADELDMFHRLKHAFDPDGILNPGKAVPTLHRCAEFGAMHVHGGRLPHADLPRF